MSSLPIALVDTADGSRALVLAVDPAAAEYVGYEPFSGQLYRGVRDMDVIGLVSDQPAAVFFGASIAASEGQRLFAANPARRGLFSAGRQFAKVPAGFLSGFPVAETTLRKHRVEVPTTSTIALSMLFALATIQTSIERAERAYECFATKYHAAGDLMPPLYEIRQCFVEAGTGLETKKTNVFLGAEPYATTIHAAMRSGARDRALRRYLATETRLPSNLGLAKLSFTLALLGNDCVCLDARLLSRMFSDQVERARAMKSYDKTAKGTLGAKQIDAYEALEDAFLRGNPHYRRDDVLGRARAQWMSWEVATSEPTPATHSVWLNAIGAA